MEPKKKMEPKNKHFHTVAGGAAAMLGKRGMGCIRKAADRSLIVACASAPPIEQTDAAGWLGTALERNWAFTLSTVFPKVSNNLSESLQSIP